MDVTAWLTELGMERYAEQFTRNEIDEDTLRKLSSGDLLELGVSVLAHRKKILSAITELANADSKIETIDSQVSFDAAHRQVTVLFADISGFTQLARELGAEATHDLLNRYFSVVDKIIEAYGGTIDKHMGDNVMAVFGAPTSHTDDPGRAVRAACEIHESVSRLETGTNKKLRVHIGIASGQVVASNTGSDAHRQYTITGESVNLASRLQDVAKAGETWVSEAVQRAVAKLANCEPPTEHAIKGFARPIRASRLIELRRDWGEDENTPFVGRHSELAQFRSILTSCREAGSGQTILIRGDAGIGKTRLIAESRRLAEEQGFSCHTGLFLDFGVAKGQDAIRSIVRSILGITAASGDQSLEDVASHAISEGLVNAQSRVFLNDLLDVPQPSELAALFDTMDNTVRNEGKLLAVTSLIRSASRKRPVLIIVEDIHWASPDELRYLAALTQTVHEVTALLVMTSRFDGDPIDQSWRTTAGNVAFSMIDLAPLRQVEARELSERYLEADAQFARDCVERAGGNPLFLTQLLQSKGSDGAVDVPDSVQSVVQARVDRLKQADRLALQAASILGQRFSPDAARYLAKRPDYDFQPLIRNSLIRTEGDAFLFSHALVRDGVYSSLLPSRRKELHRLAAAWYQKHDQILHAEHLDRAEDASASEAYLEASRTEYQLFHFERTVSLTGRGLDLVHESRARYELTCLQANALRELGETAKSLLAFGSALNTAADTPQRLTAWIGQVECLRLADRYAEALSILQKAESIASAEHQIDHLTQIHFLRGNILFPMGNIDGCLEQHELALKCAQQIGSAEGEARALGGLGDAHYLRGRMITANRYFRTCVDLSRRNGFGRIAVANLPLVGYTTRYANELREALEIAAETIRAATSVGHRRAELGGRMLAANVLLDMADFDSADLAITEAENLVRRLGTRRFEAHILLYRSIFLRSLGHRDKAIEICRLAIQVARETGPAFSGPWAMAEFAANTEDLDARNEALAEGQRMLAAGAVSHCHFQFHATAMEIFLESGDWNRADYHASALASFTQSEPVPWCDFFIARSRALSCLGRNKNEDAARKRLQELQRIAGEVGLHLASRRMTEALNDR